MTNQIVTIDPEFESFLPPLKEHEYEKLKKSILADGLRQPITIWKGEGLIVDGHNRYRICMENGIVPRFEEREFASRAAAKIWMFENQDSHRNLTKYDRARLVLELEPLYAAEAKRKQVNAGGDHGNQHTGGKSAVSQKSAEPPLRTDEQLAKLAGTSRDTIRKVKVIESEAAKGNQTAIDARESVKSGRKSINAAYMDVRPKSDKADTRPICTICGRPVDDGDSYSHSPFKHKACAMRDTEEHRGARGGRLGARLDNADHDLLNNKPVYTVDMLLDGLASSVNDLHEAWTLRIENNESMGVRLTDEQKDRLNDSVSDMLYIIECIRKEQNNG